jgi:molybdate transport system substrate-binding protein
VRTFVSAGLAVALATAVGCDRGARETTPAADGERKPLTVFAAASLTDVLGDFEAVFERRNAVDIRASYGASSDLSRQIADGAPADVYLSASKTWIEQLKKTGWLDGDYVVVARNRLVCIAAPDIPLLDPRPTGLRQLYEDLVKSGWRVAVADEGVPAGDYARQAMKSVGLLDSYKPNLVGQKDVRAVLRAVAGGELPTGFVYATDAQTAKVTVVFEVDPNLHDSIEYYAAVVSGSPNAVAARDYIVLLRAGAGRNVFETRGFGLP